MAQLRLYKTVKAVHNLHCKTALSICILVWFSFPCLLDILFVCSEALRNQKCTFIGQYMYETESMRYH